VSNNIDMLVNTLLKSNRLYVPTVSKPCYTANVDGSIVYVVFRVDCTSIVSMSGPKKTRLTTSRSVGMKVTTYSVSPSAVRRKTGIEKIHVRPTALNTDRPVPSGQSTVSEPEIIVVRTEKPETAYCHKKVAEIEEWSKAVDEMVAVAVNGNAPTSFECNMCGVEVEEVIRCLDCGPFGYYCTECEKKIHSGGGRLHKAEIWKVGLCHLFLTLPS